LDVEKECDCLLLQLQFEAASYGVFSCLILNILGIITLMIDDRWCSFDEELSVSVITGRFVTNHNPPKI
jgi:hypothetical protein